MRKSYIIIYIFIFIFTNLMIPNTCLATGNWKKINPFPKGGCINDVIFGNDTFLLNFSYWGEDIDNTTKNYIYTSNDGIKWSKLENQQMAEYKMSNFSFANDTFFILNFRGKDFIWKSMDGTNWERVDLQYTGYLKDWEYYKQTYYFNSITYGNGIYVMVGSRDGRSALIATSVDGKSWDIKDLSKFTSDNFIENDEIAKVIFANGVFIAVGHGFVWKSSDGQKWDKIKVSSVKFLNDVAFGNNRFVAIAGNRIIESSDGNSWSLINSDETQYLTNIAYADGIFVAVGDNGLILTSNNGIDWEKKSCKTENHLRTICYGNGKFLCCGGTDFVGAVVDEGTAIYYSAGFTESQKAISICYNSQEINTDIDPIIENGRVLIPFHAIFGTLNMDVEWNPIEQKVIAKNNQTVLTLKPGQYQIVKEKTNTTEIIEMDVAPKIIDSQLFVPLRFVCEAMGLNVNWDEQERQVNIKRL